MREIGRVVLGMDPHKRTVTVEVMGVDEAVLDRGRFTTDAAGSAAMLVFALRWPDRAWAVEGCAGIGKHVALRLLDAGETVVEAKLSARMRVYATSQALCKGHSRRWPGSSGGETRPCQRGTAGPGRRPPRSAWFEGIVTQHPYVAVSPVPMPVETGPRAH